MKKAVFLLFILFTALTMSSCSDSGEGGGDEGSTLSLTLDKKSIVELAEGGTTTITVTSNSNWKLSGYATWCSVSPTVGEAGTTDITIKIKSNTTLYDDRVQSYSFQDSKGNTTEYAFTVTQKKVNALILSSEKVEANVNGDSIAIVVKSNLKYSVDVQGNWISQVATRGLVESTLSFKVAESDSTDARTGRIIFSDNDSDLKDTVTVYQADNHVLLLNDNNVIVSYEGTTLTAELRTNLQYDIIMPEDEWINEQPGTRAFRSDKLKFTINPLTGDDNRETSVIFKEKNSNRADTLNVCQTADGSLLLMKSIFHLKYMRDTICVKIKQTEYTTKILDGGEAWLELNVSSITTRSGFKKDSTNIAINQNTKSYARTAKVLFTETSTGKSDTLKIIQDPTDISEIITGTRQMWVSYDNSATRLAKAPNGTANPDVALISWRLLPTDPSDVAFDIYKSVNNGDAVQLNENPISTSTCWADADMDKTATNTYIVKTAGTEQEICRYEFTPEMAQTYYRKIILNTNLPHLDTLSYNADDAQVADIDGDGEMEIILKREPYDCANQNNLYEGSTVLEAYRLDGAFLWQVDLGINIRSGSHLTPYIVRDFDNDGRCEIAIRSSEGTRFSDGRVITDVNGKVNDYRQSDGEVDYSPEYVSLIDATTGVEVARSGYIPRGAEGTKKNPDWIDYWGDGYGNRMDRFFMGAAYLDGGYPCNENNGKATAKPSLLITRGIYKNWQVWALDYDGTQLSVRWKFDTKDHSSIWKGMCSHSFRVADVDNDGQDEILYGQAVIESNGAEKYCTGNGHGDMIHVGRFFKDNTYGTLQVMACFEESNTYNQTGFGYSCAVYQASNGKMISGLNKGGSADDGRCMIADIDPNHDGFEYWSSATYEKGIYDIETGTVVNNNHPTGIGDGVMYNMPIYWDGALNRNQYDRACIVSFANGRYATFSTGYGASDGNHSTKFNPCYLGDFLGDYREEVILPSGDKRALYIFSTNYNTEHRFIHFMYDHTYDMGQMMENIGYNQGVHPGYYIGSDM